MKPFPCPNCGADDQWVAHYKTPESQGLELLVGADGAPEEGEYDGSPATAYDAEENEYYQCNACDAFVNLDGTLQAVNSEEQTRRLEAEVKREETIEGVLTEMKMALDRQDNEIVEACVERLAGFAKSL
jgi:hypothetical protein